MEELNFKKSYFTHMLLFCIVAVVFVMFGYFVSEGFAQRSYQQPDSDTGQDRNSGDHFFRLDKDGDGKISQDEFLGPNEHFTKFDTDQDGFLSESELPERPPKRGNGNMKGPKSFSSLDSDGDGKISQEEFPGPDEHFSHFDTDNDGYLSEDEMPKGPPNRKRRS